MIVLNVTYRCRPGMRDAFLARIWAEGVDAACRREDGNLKYDYYLPCACADELLLVEKWRDADALSAHGRTPHLQKLAAFKPEYVLDTVIEKFEQ